MVLALAKWTSANSFKTIYSGVAIRDFNMAPAFERSKHHEEVGGPVSVAERAGRQAWRP